MQTEEDARRERNRLAVAKYQAANREKVLAGRRAANKKHSTANREALRERSRAYYAENRDRCRARERLYRAGEAGDRIKAYDRARYAADPEGRKAHIKAWQKANPEYLAESNARRRAAALQATPPWLTLAHRRQIAAMYREAQTITMETGVAHHVDHIEPLLGTVSCGLHVPWNLQILTAENNLRKSNRLEAA